MLILIAALGISLISACGTAPRAPVSGWIEPPQFSKTEMNRVKAWRAGVCADPAKPEPCRYLKWAYRAEMAAKALEGEK